MRDRKEVAMSDAEREFVICRMLGGEELYLTPWSHWTYKLDEAQLMTQDAADEVARSMDLDRYVERRSETVAARRQVLENSPGMCRCGHVRSYHATATQGRVNLFCEHPDCDCPGFRPIVSEKGQYWYCPETGQAWPMDGHHDGDQQLVKLFDAEHLMPILDVLPRLWSDGFETKEQDGRWWLFDKSGEGIQQGSTFRDLCVNIVLAGM